MKMKAFVSSVILATAILCFSGCQSEKSETKQATNDPPQVCSAEDLVGQWKGDFEKSWEVNRKLFLADTLRGEDAYPKDEAEREKVIRKEIAPMIEKLGYAFQKDGNFVNTDSYGFESKGTYKVLSDADNLVKVECLIPSLRKPIGKIKRSPRKIELEIEFFDIDNIRIRFEGVDMILNRQS